MTDPKPAARKDAMSEAKVEAINEAWFRYLTDRVGQPLNTHQDAFVSGYLAAEPRATTPAELFGEDRDIAGLHDAADAARERDELTAKPEMLRDPKPAAPSIQDALQCLEYLDVRIDEHREYRQLLEPRIRAIRSALEHAASEAEARGWIACADRMPPTGCSVLVDGGYAYFDGIDWRTLMGATHREIEWGVTHWMPVPRLPTPPKGSP